MVHITPLSSHVRTSRGFFAEPARTQWVKNDFELTLLPPAPTTRPHEYSPECSNLFMDGWLAQTENYCSINFKQLTGRHNPRRSQHPCTTSCLLSRSGGQRVGLRERDEYDRLMMASFLEVRIQTPMPQWDGAMGRRKWRDR